MPTVYVLAIHVLVLTCLAAVTVMALGQIFVAPSGVPRLLRALALAGGFLFFLGAKAATTSMPDLLTAVTSFIKPFNFPLLDAIVPITAGALAAWFLTYAVEHDKTQERLVYLLLMLSTFLISMFSDVYAASWQGEKTAGLNQQLEANLVFVLGLIIYVLFFRKVGVVTKMAKKETWRDKI